MTPHDEAPSHEFEAEHGLPEPLPRGERLLWQGAPDWRVLARQALHVRLLVGYFAVLIGWRAAGVLADGGGASDAALAVLGSLPLAALAVGLVLLLAWLVGRTSLYTVTDRRVVMRIGVVLSITFNLPCTQIESAGLRTNADGSGDITLVLAPSDRIAYLHLWPHARPWHLKRAEPMLRALPQAHVVAALLADALAASAGRVAPERPSAAVAGWPAGVVDGTPAALPAVRQPLAA